MNSEKLKLFDAEIKDLAKKNNQGQITHKASRLLDRIHESTMRIRELKDGMREASRIYNLQIEAETKRLTQLQEGQSSLKIRYDLCMGALKQKKKFSQKKSTPKPVEKPKEE